MSEHFRCRIYWGDTPISEADLMAEAMSPRGLHGDVRRFHFPPEYVARHVQENDGWFRVGPERSEAFARLMARGWLERTEVTSRMQETTGWLGLPEHTATRVVYRASVAGREAMRRTR